MTNRPDHWDPNIKRYCFEKISRQGVETDITERAQAAAAFVCEDLRILNPPKIVWICPAHPDAVSAAVGDRVWDVRQEEHHDTFTRLKHDILEGYTPERPNSNEIWIRSNLIESPNLEFVVAHELRHLWQKLHIEAVFQDESRAEGDAYPYAYQILKRYLETQGRLTAAVCRDIAEKRAGAELWFRNQWSDAPFEMIQLAPSGGGSRS